MLMCVYQGESYPENKFGLISGQLLYPTVFIFDQFEQFLGGLRQLSRPELEVRLAEMRTILTGLVASPTRSIVLSLRKEWYYDLRPLGDIILPRLRRVMCKPAR